MQIVKFLKQRRMLMALPLLAAPSLIILFILFGGRNDGDVGGEGHLSNKGINPKLPDAHFKKGRDKDKLGLYEQSNMDSAKQREAFKNDPFLKYAMDTASENRVDDLQKMLKENASKYNQRDLTSLNRTNPIANPFPADPNETKLIQELAKLKNQLGAKSENNLQPVKNPPDKNAMPDLDRLQQMIGSFKQNNSPQSDPEIKQIDRLLEKIITVQHPERLTDSMGKVALQKKLVGFPVSLSGESEHAGQTGFYGLCRESGEITDSSGIQAVTEETQSLVSGSLVRMRLLQDIYIAGRFIPKGQIISGIASLTEERLKISVSSIRSGSEIFPVSMEVFDMDGLQGVYIPGSITRDVSKESAGDAIASIGLGGLDPSLGAQAASAGIQAAKTLMTKKIKLVRVRVKAGYQVILRDNNRK